MARWPSSTIRTYIICDSGTNPSGETGRRAPPAQYLDVCDSLGLQCGQNVHAAGCVEDASVANNGKTETETVFQHKLNEPNDVNQR